MSFFEEISLPLKSDEVAHLHELHHVKVRLRETLAEAERDQRILNAA